MTGESAMNARYASCISKTAMSRPTSTGATMASTGNGALSGSDGGSGMVTRAADGRFVSRGDRVKRTYPSSPGERAASAAGAVATVIADRPAQISSPGVSGDLSYTGWPAITVPLVDPASATATVPSAVRSTRKCLAETSSSPSRSGASRPTTWPDEGKEMLAPAAGPDVTSSASDSGAATGTRGRAGSSL